MSGAPARASTDATCAYLLVSPALPLFLLWICLSCPSSHSRSGYRSRLLAARFVARVRQPSWRGIRRFQLFLSPLDLASRLLLALLWGRLLPSFLSRRL